MFTVDCGKLRDFLFSRTGFKSSKVRCRNRRVRERCHGEKAPVRFLATLLSFAVAFKILSRERLIRHATLRQVGKPPLEQFRSVQRVLSDANRYESHMHPFPHDDSPGGYGAVWRHIRGNIENPHRPARHVSEDLRYVDHDTITCPEQSNLSVEAVNSAKLLHDSTGFDVMRDVNLISLTWLTHYENYPPPRIPSIDEGDYCSGRVHPKGLWRLLPCTKEYRKDKRVLGVNQPCGFFQYVATRDCTFIDSVGQTGHPDVLGNFINSTHVIEYTYQKYHTIPIPEQRRALFEEAIRNTRYHDEVISILATYPDANSHFMLETLPNLLYLLEVLQHKQIPILYRESDGVTIVSQMFEYLDSLNLLKGKTRIRTASNAFDYARKVYFASHYPGSCLTDSQKWAGPELTSRVKRLLASPDLNVSQRNKVILVHRSGNTRSISNWEEMKSGLQEVIDNHTGFQLVTYETLPTFREIVELFKSAAVIIGAHGAGLSNLLFSADCTSLLEIMYSEVDILPTPTAFYSYAIARSLDYWMLVENGGYFDSIHVRIPIIQQVLDQVLQEKANAARLNMDESYCLQSSANKSWADPMLHQSRIRA